MEQSLLFISTLFWQTACPVPLRLKLTSQKLILTKILNKHPFLEVKGVRAYLRGAHSIIFSIEWALIPGGAYSRGGAYLRSYGNVCFSITKIMGSFLNCNENFSSLLFLSLDFLHLSSENCSVVTPYSRAAERGARRTLPPIGVGDRGLGAAALPTLEKFAKISNDRAENRPKVGQSLRKQWIFYRAAPQNFISPNAYAPPGRQGLRGLIIEEF